MKWLILVKLNLKDIAKIFFSLEFVFLIPFKS